MPFLPDFGISFAAGVALELVKKLKRTHIQTEIKDAFEEALKGFYNGGRVDVRGRADIKQIIDKHAFDPSEEMVDLYKIEKYGRFFSLFNEAIAKRTVAYDYLKEIKDSQRFKAEMAKIEELKDDIAELKDLIVASSSNSATDLIGEYRRQIEQYGENINSFNPSVALRNLEALEQSFTQNGFVPDDAIKARIQFLKAQCLKIIPDRINDYYPAVIKAYYLNRNDFRIKEAACLSFYKIEDKEEAIRLSEEIIGEDRYNPIGQVVNVLLQESIELAPLLDDIPIPVIRNLDFKRLLYAFVIGKQRYSDLALAFAKFQITFIHVSFDELPNTLENHGKRVYVVECELNKMLSNCFIHFEKVQIDKTPYRNSLDLLIEFLKGVEGTEVESTFNSVKFYRYYFDFLINGKKDSVYLMKDAYDKFNREKIDFDIMAMANSLQQIDDINGALKILNECDLITPQTLDLEMFCYHRKKDIPNFVRVAEEFLKTLDSAKGADYFNLFVLVMRMSDFGKLESFDINYFIEDKVFEDKEVKTLLKSFLIALRKNGDEKVISELAKIEDHIIGEFEHLGFFLGMAYYELNNYEKCVYVYEQVLDLKQESEGFFQYIHALSRVEGKPKELLANLTYWRENFSRQDIFLKLEVDLRRKLHEYGTCKVICEKFFEENKSDEFIITNYAVVLNEIETATKEEFSYLSNLVKGDVVKYYQYGQRIAAVLIENDFKLEALDIYFKFASDPLNAEARRDYFMATLKMPEKTLEEFEIVDVGHHLKYEINGIIQFTQILKGSDFFDSVTGAKTGDSVQIKSKFGGKNREIKILRIMNKYLRLHDEIHNEVDTDPLSGIGMQSFDLSDYMGEDKSILDFFAELGSNKGYDPNKLYHDYYSGNVSFLQLVESEYSYNFIRGFLDLKYAKKKLFQIPNEIYPNLELSFYEDIILDFSSVIKLYDFQLTNQVGFDRKFILSTSTYSVIRTFSKEGIIYGNTEYALNKEYYQGLMDWINKNCDLKMSEHKLDVEKRLGDNPKNNVLRDLLIDAFLLVADSEKSLLITDELFGFKFLSAQSGRIVSLDKFIQLHGVQG